MTRFVVMAIAIAILYISMIKCNRETSLIYNGNTQPGLYDGKETGDIDCPVTAGALMSAYTFY